MFIIWTVIFCMFVFVFCVITIYCKCVWTNWYLYMFSRRKQVFLPVWKYNLRNKKDYIFDIQSVNWLCNSIVKFFYRVYDCEVLKLIWYTCVCTDLQKMTENKRDFGSFFASNVQDTISLPEVSYPFNSKVQKRQYNKTLLI